MPEIKKVLVANRGEIAIRVIRSLKELGIETVAVYSEADRKAPHVIMADEIFCLGKAPSTDSYLNQPKILEACRKLKVDAVHPGYGFLSENAEFARLIEENKIVFIGPSASSIEIMGSKIKAKEAVAAYDIPLVPGTAEPVTDHKVAEEQAISIGFPLLIKASAGGGGKGMRIVESPEEFQSQLQRASSEAKSAFGDGSVFLEKFITHPRHIEVQVIGDQHGNIVHLFERECSIQRRHQKVIEEAPSPAVSPALRQKLGQAAVDVARAANYHGAGTVEFMLDQDQQFYFLEMNTRLQVEHPITEMITGIDLVKEQIRVAEGKKLSMRQQDLKINGHAIEARVYAEDPESGFLPDTGSLHYYQIPRGPGVRVDDGYRQGMEVPIYYDPMIAKLIVHGSNREEAIQRMIRAIDEYRIVGVKTTLEFCQFVMRHSKFQQGEYTTRFIQDHYQVGTGNSDQNLKQVAAAMAAYLYQQARPRSTSQSTILSNSTNSWKSRAKNL